MYLLNLHCVGSLDKQMKRKLLYFDLCKLALHTAKFMYSSFYCLGRYQGIWNHKKKSAAFPTKNKMSRLAFLIA